MILRGANAPVPAHDSNPGMHEAARHRCLSGGVGLAWAARPGWVRITTHRKIIARPLPATERGLPYPTDTEFARFSGLRRIHPRLA